jgi:hypothetical protein
MRCRLYESRSDSGATSAAFSNPLQTDQCLSLEKAVDPCDPQVGNNRHNHDSWGRPSGRTLFPETSADRDSPRPCATEKLLTFQSTEGPRGVKEFRTDRMGYCGLRIVAARPHRNSGHGRGWHALLRAWRTSQTLATPITLFWAYYPKPASTNFASLSLEIRISQFVFGFPPGDHYTPLRRARGRQRASWTGRTWTILYAGR